MPPLKQEPKKKVPQMALISYKIRASDSRSPRNWLKPFTRQMQHHERHRSIVLERCDEWVVMLVMAPTTAQLPFHRKDTDFCVEENRSDLYYVEGRALDFGALDLMDLSPKHREMARQWFRNYVPFIYDRWREKFRREGFRLAPGAWGGRFV